MKKIRLPSEEKLIRKLGLHFYHTLSCHEQDKTCSFDIFVQIQNKNPIKQTKAQI